MVLPGVRPIISGRTIARDHRRGDDEKVVAAVGLVKYRSSGFRLQGYPRFGRAGISSKTGANPQNTDGTGVDQVSLSRLS
jgi:hypothetical protein